MKYLLIIVTGSPKVVTERQFYTLELVLREKNQLIEQAAKSRGICNGKEWLLAYESFKYGSLTNSGREFLRTNLNKPIEKIGEDFRLWTGDKYFKVTIKKIP